MANSKTKKKTPTIESFKLMVLIIFTDGNLYKKFALQIALLEISILISGKFSHIKDECKEHLLKLI